MHTNYYFLRQLAPALSAYLTGLRFMECFSQDRDEVVLVFAQAKGKINYYKPFYIKASLRPEFSGLLFPETVQRARTNSVDLFGVLIEEDQVDRQPSEEKNAALVANQSGRAVLGVRSFLNERCLAIILDDDCALLFKFFGNRPNLLAFHGNEVVDLFNHNMISDQQLTLNTLDRPIDQSYEAFEKANFDHRKLFPTFGKVVNAWLVERQKSVAEDERVNGEKRWNLIQEALYLLESPRYYLMRFDHKPTLSLLPWPEFSNQSDGLDNQVDVRTVREFGEPIEAANRLYISYNGLNTFEHEKADLLRLLEKRLKRAQAQLDANMERLIARDEGPSHEEIGHILMANLHDLSEWSGAKLPDRVTLYDFYREQPITIKLKPDLNPQKNAESYYRKAKNEKIEADYLADQITTREAEIIRINQQKVDIESIGMLKELRRYVKQHVLLNDQRGNGLNPGEVGTAPIFKEVFIDDFRILIGRNAKNNDLLTQKYAHKEDLWLHARDVSGSHVVIKYRAGKPFPKNVIERAAELAAWYSKRRTDSLCPVTVTPKKFVRKPKGLAEGQVIVEKEDVVMVVPRGD